MLGSVESKLPYERQTLGHEVAEARDLESIACREPKKVAGSGIIQRFLLQCPPRTPRIEGDISTSLNHDYRSRKEVGAVLGLEMLSGTPGKGGHQRGYHGGQQTKKLGIRSILSICKGVSESRLMGEWGERVNIGEEVVDQEFENG